MAQATSVSSIVQSVYKSVFPHLQKCIKSVNKKFASGMHEVDFKEWKERVFLKAVRRNYRNVVVFLLAEVGQQVIHTAISIAVRKNNSDMLRLLIADTNVDIGYEIVHAAQRGFLDIVKILKSDKRVGSRYDDEINRVAIDRNDRELLQLLSARQ